MAVQLAAGSQRHPLQVHIGRGHHVGGQGRLQLGAQRLGRQRGRTAVVGDQPRLSDPVVADQHHRFAHALAAGQPCLDLAGLDAEAAQLHLMIVAAQVDDVAVRLPAAQVAGPVHPRAAVAMKRIGHETLGGQPGAMQVAAGHAGASHMNFARHADGHGRAVRVENVDLRIGDRTADHGVRRHMLGPGIAVERGITVDLRRAVEIQQPNLRIRGEALPGQLGSQALAAADQRAQSIEAGFTALQQVFQQRRHHHQMGHARLAQPPCEHGQILHGRVVEDNQGAAREQRAQGLGDGIHKADAGLERGDRRLRQHVAEEPLQAVGQAGDRRLDALGLAGGARGVDHVGQVVWLQCLDLRIVFGLAFQWTRQVQHRHRQCP